MESTSCYLAAHRCGTGEGMGSLLRAVSPANQQIDNAGQQYHGHNGTDAEHGFAGDQAANWKTIILEI